MSNPTSNFGWQMPTATDLVTDLPADFEVFGQAVDTDFVDLLGGTTGQILSKTSATDLDFTWIANDQGDITGVTAGTGISVTSPTGPVPTVAIDTAVTVDKTTAQTLTNKTLTSPALTTPTISTATTNGDLLYGTGSGALQRLGIGSASQVLSVSGGIPAWSTPAAATSGYTFISRSTFSAVATADIDSIFTSTYETYQVVIETCFSSTDSELKMQLRYAGPNTQTTDYYGTIRRFNGTYTNDGGTNISAGTHFLINDKIRTGAGQASNSTFTINQVGNGSRNPILYGIGNSGSYIMPTICNGYMLTAREYTGIRLAAVSGNLTAQVTVYGLAKA